MDFSTIMTSVESKDSALRKKKKIHPGMDMTGAASFTS
jgi:hypothetical protein